MVRRPEPMGPRILLIDDEREFAELFAARQRLRHPGLAFEVCNSPREALGRLRENFTLIIVDLHMPEMDGRAFVRAAVAAGVDAKRMVVHSAYTADELHDRFSLGECLAVINKLERKQKAVLDLILDSVAQSAPVA